MSTRIKQLKLEHRTEKPYPVNLVYLEYLVNLVYLVLLAYLAHPKIISYSAAKLTSVFLYDEKMPAREINPI